MSFTTLLVLGNWTDRLSTAGAAAGLLTGATTSTLAVVITIVSA